MSLSPDWYDMHPYPPEEHDHCPDCGETLGARPRDHRCKEPR
jgi:hypothetical protein